MVIAFDDVIADLEANKNSSPIFTELFLKGTKLNSTLLFVSQSYFKIPKIIRLNATHYLIMEIHKR